VFGAILIALLGDGPHLNLHTHSADTAQHGVLTAFRYRDFRSAAFGYFGHMWELYAFWTVVPLFLARASIASALHVKSVYGLSFLVIGTGALGCIAGGVWSRRIGSAKVAAAALALSGACAVIFALGWRSVPPAVLLMLLVVWGAAVVADSPQFSALSAQACPRALIGGALTLQNSIGFAITVVSIPATTALFERIGLDAAWLLVPGPVLGLIGFAPLLMRAGRVSDPPVQ
jgi:MFS family permease